MSAQRKRLVELVENLPADLEQEVTDFVLFILQKRGSVQEASQEVAVDQNSSELAPNPFRDLIEMADRYNLSSGRSDISSRASELAGEAISEDFIKRRRESHAGEQPDSH